MQELSTKELEDIMQDLTGRSELTLEQVQTLYDVEEELKRRRNED